MNEGGKEKTMTIDQAGKEEAMSTSEEIRIGQMAIRFRLEGQESGGSVAVFEFDVPAAARVPIAHSHDGYEETIYGLEGVLSWTVDGERSDGGPGGGRCWLGGAGCR